MDTIFGLSSGAPPAGVALIRISGPQAGAALRQLAHDLPQPRYASLRTLRNADGAILDRALVLWLPGPRSATGEDMAELHLHGGRAVVAAVERALAATEGLRRAQPGEFTRRAFTNGKIDLAEAEGLADLLAAETELQRLNAEALAGGGFSCEVETWRGEVLALSALIEAQLDFGDEDDVSALPADFAARCRGLAEQWQDWLERPRAERLRDGYRVVLAGPPNSGKSSLFNALLESEAAIVHDIAGTTRDVLERGVALAGVPFTFVDVAGLRDETGDPVEAVGIARAREQLARADLVLWLGPEGEGPGGAWEIAAKQDLPGQAKRAPLHRVSVRIGQGVSELRSALVEAASKAMPRPGEVALNARQHALMAEAHEAIAAIDGGGDHLLVAEQLRLVRVALDRLVGRMATEDMLDALFGGFCIGK